MQDVVYNKTVIRFSGVDNTAHSNISAEIGKVTNIIKKEMAAWVFALAYFVLGIMIALLTPEYTDLVAISIFFGIVFSIVGTVITIYLTFYRPSVDATNNMMKVSGFNEAAQLLPGYRSGTILNLITEYVQSSYEFSNCVKLTYRFENGVLYVNVERPK